MSVRTWFRRTGGRFGVWLYRRTGGRALTGTAHPRVLLLTTPGRRTGEPRSTCVAFLEHDGGYLVWGTGSGARHDPQWFRNLRASALTQVQVLDRRFTATVHECRGEERDRLWTEVITARVPGVRRYARRAGRTIPVAILRPRARDAGA